MMEQLSFLPEILSAEQVEEMNRLEEQSKQAARLKRNWENRFQNWSDESFKNQDGSYYGCCGYGSMCDWCDGTDYGRACVRALNAMLREKKQHVDYTKRNFEEIWSGEGMEDENGCGEDL